MKIETLANPNPNKYVALLDFFVSVGRPKLTVEQ